jgi:N utilization substance protein A
MMKGMKLFCQEKQIPSDFSVKEIMFVDYESELKGTNLKLLCLELLRVLEKLFEQEIPEVFDGLIMVKIGKNSR